MNNNYLLSLVSSAVPLLAIGFVAVLLIYKIYIKIRSKFNTAVNCWFCNQNARVPYLEANSWTCPHCEQYNGFTKDGDYNREMYQQLDCSNLSSSGTKSICQSDHSSPRRTLLPPRNGFCEGCNEAQRLKVEKLAQFEPKNESHFDEELKVYKAKLEEQYRLCSTCDRHLGKVLREKKKMVLGSKFLDFIIKGAETLKQPHFNQLRFARQQHWKQRFARCTTLLAIGNIVCLLCVLPTLKRETLTNILGEVLGTQLFIGCSHLLALSKVLGAYVETAAAQPLLIKSALFMRTLFMMLLYSLGLKWPQIVSFHFGSLYLLVGPFGLLACAFGYNVFDGFRLNRFTFLLALWSAFAAGLFDEERVSVSVWISKEALMLIYSVCTLLLSLSSKHETTAKLHDDTAHSFHKLYSEDYFSDDETMSMLSQQLNSSAVSMRSAGSSCSPRSTNTAAATTTAHYAELHKSPSLRSLNLPRNTQLSPNSSFRSFCLDDNQSLLRSPHYAASLCNFPTSVPPPPMVRSPLFASSQELSCGGGISINDTLTNGSFLPPLSQPQRKSDESLWRGSSSYNNQPPQHAFSTAYSASNNAVHQQRAHSLITPSRFSNDCLASNASAASWLSGGYFNQRHPLTNQQHQQQLLLQQQPRNGMSVIAESLSRASSHSSGFESQHERPCASRENSYGPEPLDVLQRTICVDDARGFLPIDGSCYSPRASLLSQPLTVNCATTAAPQQHDLWPRAPVMRENGFGAARDSFNLRQINAELPSIRRGDLLKKWKQSQAST